MTPASTSVLLGLGLGNQLFQYAHGYAYAKRNGLRLILNLSVCGTAGFSISAFPIEADAIVTTSNKAGERARAGIPVVWEELPPRNNLTLSGSWCSEKYFCSHAAELRRMFAEPVQSIEFSARLDGILVSLHVRRGDYLEEAHLERRGMICDQKYYQDAIVKIRAKVADPVFVVFSDDIPWCRENFPSDFLFIEGNKDHEDLVLMSRCDHHIIANSTFSWWGAWLNPKEDKIVIYPDLYTTDYPPNSESDFIPDSWKQ